MIIEQNIIQLGQSFDYGGYGDFCFVFSKSQSSTLLPYLENKENMSKILDTTEVEIPLQFQIFQIYDNICGFSSLAMEDVNTIVQII